MPFITTPCPDPFDPDCLLTTSPCGCCHHTNPSEGKPFAVLKCHSHSDQGDNYPFMSRDEFKATMSPASV